MNSGSSAITSGNTASAGAGQVRKLALDLAAVGSRDALIDRLFKALFAAAGWLVLIVLVAVGEAVDAAGRPRSVFHRLDGTFLVSADWDAVQHKFGALVPIYGTVITSLIAMLLAVPAGFGIALFLTEVWRRTGCVWPGCIRDRIARRHSVQHHLRHVGPVRVRALHGSTSFRSSGCSDNLGQALADPGHPVPRVRRWSIGMLTAGIVLGHHGDSVYFLGHARCGSLTVPTRLKESAYALGSTTWEVAWDVVLP